MVTTEATRVSTQQHNKQKKQQIQNITYTQQYLTKRIEMAAE